MEVSAILLCDVQIYGLPEDLAECCLASQTWLLSWALVPYCSDTFRFRLTSLPEHLSFRGSSCNIILVLSVMPWRNGMAVHPSVGGCQLLLGPTTAFGPFLRLTTAPYS
jgi:hypothetical protein